MTDSKWQMVRLFRYFTNPFDTNRDHRIYFSYKPSDDLAISDLHSPDYKYRLTPKNCAVKTNASFESVE
jgi:hypothetical protein